MCYSVVAHADGDSRRRRPHRVHLRARRHSGAWTFTLVAPADHAVGGDENDLTINLSSILRATDFDKDTVAASGQRLVITATTNRRRAR